LAAGSATYIRTEKLGDQDVVRLYRLGPGDRRTPMSVAVA
jgi:hypothetical protein